MLKTTLFMVSLQVLLSKTHMHFLLLTICSCILMSSMMFFMSMNYWTNILIVLVFISGIMVLFMFIVSLSPNEKYPTKPKTSLLVNLIALLLVPVMLSNKTPLTSKHCWEFKMNMMLLTMMIIMIVLMAIIPPLMNMCFFSGMKSTK